MQYSIFLALLAFVLGEMALSGPLGRESLPLAPGMHWYAIAIVLVIFLAYMMRDRISIKYLPTVALVYYSIHEAQFNLFFMSYHGFGIPGGIKLPWYAELGTAIATSIVVIAQALSPKTRRNVLRNGAGRVGISLWLSTFVFYGVWILAGFPVTINVYNPSVNAVTNFAPVASAFEFVQTIIFTIAFYYTLDFELGRRDRSERNRVGKKLVSESDYLTPMAALFLLRPTTNLYVIDSPSRVASRVVRNRPPN